MIDSATLPLQIGVKAFIKNTKGEYLLLLRAKPYDPSGLCKWDIPGGRINVEESLIEALAREIKEETGLTLEGTPQLLLAQDIFHNPKHIVRLTYVAKASGKVIIDPKEHQQYDWYKISELKKLYHDSYLTPVFPLLSTN
jgi:ADP-ribose pyrophosphatase YjhB (NUDIX family)